MATEGDYHRLIGDCLKAVVVVQPRSPYLSMDQLKQVAKARGMGAGPIPEAMQMMLGGGMASIEASRLGYRLRRIELLVDFTMYGTPGPDDPRKPAALDLPFDMLERKWRDEGSAGEHFTREEFSAAAAALDEGLTEHDLDVALAYLGVGGWLVEEKGVYKRAPHGVARQARPSKNMEARSDGRPYLGEVLPYVRAVLATPPTPVPIALPRPAIPVAAKPAVASSPAPIVIPAALSAPPKDTGIMKKRIFLSHKSIDKPRVEDFRDTLRVLGYLPWFDVDDLRASSTSPTRGIHEGFAESCAAVLFITKHFVDEKWLGEEIDYACARRREGDFEIIIIVFDGASANVPKLLAPLCGYKSVSSDLHGLREIILSLRALEARLTKA